MPTTTTTTQAPRILSPSLILNVAAPMILYLVLRGPLGSDTIALAIGAAVPLVVTLTEFIVHRRINPIGIFVLISFAIVLAVLIATGGDPLILKLHEAIVTGPLGLACLCSALIGKPLMLTVAAKTGAQPNRKAATVLTVIIGAMLLVHAVVLLGLALTMSTTTFVTVGRPIGWVVLAIGIGSMMLYRNKIRAAAQH